MSRRTRKVQRATGGENVRYSTAKSIVKAVHVAPSEQGKWTVRKAGKSRISKVFPSKDAAMDYARELKPAWKSEVVVHRIDGTVEIGRIAPSGRFTVKALKSPLRSHKESLPPAGSKGRSAIRDAPRED